MVEEPHNEILPLKEVTKEYQKIVTAAGKERKE